LEDRRLLSVRPTDPREPWSFRFQSISVPGSPDAAHAPDKPYALPVPPGKAFRVTQGFGGEPSHRNHENYHAVDFAMPVGTPVHAARGGIVMEVARWFHEAGTDAASYGRRANFIRVLHHDGTMAVYAHLDFEGVLVQPGDRIERGQHIGYSGNTGFSSGPHLHFVVQKNDNMALASVSIVFETSSGRWPDPQVGDRVSPP
jgi:murein DD-endopeptidase MepM/ murein hydrolase activator NlpD